jgi:hypothetical protein
VAFEKEEILMNRLMILVGTFLPLLSVGAATASFMPGGVGETWQKWVLEHAINPIEQLETQLKKTDPILETMMKVALGQSWSTMKSTTNATTPDPYKVRTIQTDVSPGILTTNSIVRQRDTANLYDQELARAIAAPVLGQTGQETLKQSAEKSNQIIQSTQQGFQETRSLAQQAKSASSTQDVMKVNAEMTSTLAGLITNQAQLTVQNQTELLKLQQMAGMTVELAANTSEGIDETNRRDRVTRQLEIGSAAQTELYMPGLYNTATR